jgi:hypothetical protein
MKGETVQRLDGSGAYGLPCALRYSPPPVEIRGQLSKGFANAKVQLGGCSQFQLQAFNTKFNEHLSQFQGKETTAIEREDIRAIMLEIMRLRIDPNDITATQMKMILKNLKMDKYLEHRRYIINKVNGKSPLKMTRDVEEKLRKMFRMIQEPYQRHCPETRNNFLNYNYCLHKFCTLLSLDEYLPCFSMLKSRPKLLLHERIWKEICKDLRWQFIPYA